MTRKERDEVVRLLAASLNLTAEPTGNNSWHVWSTNGYRGLLSYNQRSGVWKVLGGVFDKAHFGELVAMFNLLACTKADPDPNAGAGTGAGTGV
jgi:hypothetical protein